MCLLWKGFWLDGSLAFEPRSIVIALADGLCELGEGITSTEGLHDWGRRAVPLFNYTLVFTSQLKKSTENLSQGSREVEDDSLCQLG
jgi:hypothetical protein